MLPVSINVFHAPFPEPVAGLKCKLLVKESFINKSNPALLSSPEYDVCNIILTLVAFGIVALEPVVVFDIV